MVFTLLFFVACAVGLVLVVLYGIGAIFMARDMAHTGVFSETSNTDDYGEPLLPANDVDGEWDTAVALEDTKDTEETD